MDWLLPNIAGRLRRLPADILSRIGAGGMAEVSKARDTRHVLQLHLAFSRFPETGIPAFQCMHTQAALDLS
jgi:hypothetical protein